MAVSAMEEQLRPHRQLYKCEIPKKSHIWLREDKLAALLINAVDEHLQLNNPEGTYSHLILNIDNLYLACSIIHGTCHIINLNSLLGLM